MIYTIKDLREGKVALVNDYGLQVLTVSLYLAFPDFPFDLTGSAKYYFLDKDSKGNWPTPTWYCSNKTDLPTQSARVFYSEIISLRNELSRQER